MPDRTVPTDSHQPSSEGQPGPVVVLTPRGRWWMFGGFGALALVLGLDATSTNPFGGSWEVPTVVAVLCAMAAVRYLFVRVWVGVGGVEVHNFARAWRVPWFEIAAFTTVILTDRGSGHAITPAMVLWSGRRHQLNALSSGDSSRVDASIQRLQSFAPPGSQPRLVSHFELQGLLAARKTVDPASGTQSPSTDDLDAQR
jgi:hypothetical protein